MKTTDKPDYTDGQRIVCPLCGQRTAVKMHHRIENFKVVESYAVCALCQKRLPKPPSPPEQEKKSSALASLLGMTAEEEQKMREKREEDKKILGETARRFCKDCRHYIKHPFLSRCGLNNHSVEPMDDCERFESLTHKEDQP
jgi:DNA-directed RNA polymerase subunit RPC12/RpoP